MCCRAIQTRGNFSLPFNVLRGHSDKGQLFVAIQCAVVPFRQEAASHCHSMRRGAVQIRGNFPLPFKTPQCHFKQGATFRCHAVSFRQGAIFHCYGSKVVHLKSRFRARSAVAVCEIVFENFLLRLTNLLEKYSIFKTGPFLGPKRGKFSVIIA